MLAISLGANNKPFKRCCLNEHNPARPGCSVNAVKFAYGKFDD